MDHKSFIQLFQKEEVVELSNKLDNRPLVSVCIQTYQHVNYISDCLEGILNQKTNFKYEILIGEDESNDGTLDVCMSYAKKHPEIIRLFLHKRINNIAINGQPSGRFVFLSNLFLARGKYIALCEGDDYWTDPYKLQKQVDFLEANEEAVGTFHVCNTIRNGEVVKTSQAVEEPIDSVEKLFKNWREIHTLSLVFRNADEIIPAYAIKKVRAGDLLLCTYLLSRGSLYSLKDNMGNYRKHEGGVSKSYELGKELLFKSSNMLFLQELLTDIRYEKDWPFIKSYLEELIGEFERELVRANHLLKSRPNSFKGFVKRKIKNTLFKKK